VMATNDAKSMEKKNIVVWFSCGAASAVAAKLTVDKYEPEFNVMIVNNPVDEEEPDNLRFMADVSNWLGKEILCAKNTKLGHTSAYEVWEKRKYMAGVGGAPCTLLLKKEARYEFEKSHDIAFHVLGFTADEGRRHERFTKFERGNVLPILIDAGITKGRCFEIVEEAGIVLPLSYRLGFANANCVGCVKASSPIYWQLVRKKFPAVFESRAEQSRRIGCRLVKLNGKRIFLDELPDKQYKGKIKGYECGIFCDTK